MNHLLSTDTLASPRPQQPCAAVARCAAPPGKNRRAHALIGNTPMLWISAPSSTRDYGYWAKLEGFNPGGSMKDRPAMHMVARARARGDLPPGARIIESTSGSLGLGLALAGAIYGHPVTVVTDTGMEPIIQRMLRAHGVDLDVVTQPHTVGGWQQARNYRVAELLDADPHAWCPDQYNNPDNVDAYRPLALELLAQLGHVDVLVCSVGTGGHSAGVARVLRHVNPGLRLIGVDAVGSTIFGQPATTRLMRGLGSSIYPHNVDYPAFAEVRWVAPAEAVRVCRSLTATHHVSGGWSVGAVGLVAEWVARTASPDTTIAAVFPDGPHRYFDTVYNDDYCKKHDLITHVPLIEPAVITHPGQRIVESWTRCTAVVNSKRTIR
ncbi:PLP-dependent cysteine synthase family protein [Mycobacterium sp.]|uniref:PLP-dependent cysteine synthase family protein n=1 Tax=Mycobacterium sp. TaxID=1785 RepID=UPI003BAACC7C